MRIGALLVALAACKQSPPPDHGNAQDPWGAPATTAPETEAGRAHRMEAALAHVHELVPKLAALRGIAFDRDVPCAYQTKEAMRAYIHAEVAKDFPRSADTSAALFHVGLLPGKIDLAEAEERAHISQAGAYYNSTEKHFFIVIAPETGLLVDGLAVHELVHALQDQRYGLDNLLPRNTLNADDLAARQFLVEGDATFTMFLFAATQTRGTASPEMVRMLRGELAQLARLSPSEMLKQNTLGVGASTDPEFAKSLGTLDQVPLTLVVPTFDAYLYGAELVAAAYEAGGWSAVDALYANPPESTEQVLHPMTKLFPHRESPVSLELTAPADETTLANLVLGELQWQIYFELWAPDQKIVASEGWGGDRVLVTRRRDGKLVARILTVWDTPKDADEFRTAYLASLAKRFPAGSGAADSSSGFVRDDGGGRIFLRQSDTRVVIVDGATERDALDKIP